MSNTVCYKRTFDSGIQGTTRFKHGSYDGEDPNMHSRTVSATLATSSTIVPASSDPDGWHKNGWFLFSLPNDNYSPPRSCKTILLGGILPPSKSPLLLSYKFGVKNPNYKRSKYTGEIVVSPFQVGKTMIDFNVVPVIVDQGPCSIPGASANLYGGPLTPGNNITYGSGNPYTYQTNQFYECRHGVVTSFKDCTGEVSEEWLRSRFSQMYPILEDPDFVQDTIASANERDVDLLTNLFELPETILSIGKTYKSVRTYIQRFIDRKNLTEKERTRYLQRCARIEEQIIQKIGYFSNQLINYSPTERLAQKNRKSLDFWERRLKKFNKDKKNFLVTFTESISSAWLRLRYEILPVLYTCEGLAKTAESRWNKFATSRSKRIEDYEAPIVNGFTFKGKSEVTWKCMVKYGYAQQESLSDLRKSFSVNAFLTLWELGKLTFVLDWFFSVGNFLSASFGRPSLAVTDGMTLSSKLMIKGTYTSISSGLSFNVEAEHYNRVIVKQEDFSGIFLRINLNWMRYADSGALLFGELKRHFKLR